MPMRQASAFDPDILKIVQITFDDTWACLQPKQQARVSQTALAAPPRPDTATQSDCAILHWLTLLPPRFDGNQQTCGHHSFSTKTVVASPKQSGERQVIGRRRQRNTNVPSSDCLARKGRQ